MSSQDYAQAYEALDKAAGQTTRFLTGLNIRHGFIGGYATSLIGGRRITYDIDIIIDADPKTIQTQLVENCQDFTISSQNKLHFQSGIDTVTIEMLRGGGDRQLKLPDPKTVELVELAPRSRPGRVESTFMPVVTPSILLITKIKRWFFVEESSRPKSNRKAKRDVVDIMVLLKWLSMNEMKIDLGGYTSKPKDQLVPMFRRLYAKSDELRLYLEQTLEKEDLDAIKN